MGFFDAFDDIYADVIKTIPVPDVIKTIPVPDVIAPITETPEGVADDEPGGFGLGSLFGSVDRLVNSIPVPDVIAPITETITDGLEGVADNVSEVSGAIENRMDELEQAQLDGIQQDRYAYEQNKNDPLAVRMAEAGFGEEAIGHLFRDPPSTGGPTWPWTRPTAAFSSSGTRS